MGDKELLELAAKAAEVEYDPDGSKPHPKSGAFWGLWLVYRDEPSEYDRRYWNPLTDDGDALRLAVEIGPLEFSISEYGTAVRKPNGLWHGCEAHLHGGKQAATRRAIVLAAASIGAKMGEESS